MLKQDQKNLVAKIKNNKQSEITAKLLDLEMSDAFLNSVNSYLISQKERRITIAAVVANARNHKVTKNPTDT
jgi:hypothetical protein